MTTDETNGDDVTGDDGTAAVITIGDETTAIEITGIHNYVIPRGMVSLHRAHVTADPPLPENLTNAIGDMMDHLADAVRQLPLLKAATTVIVAGAAAEAVAAVEIGGVVGTDLFELSRNAAEDVFRTLATEPKNLRRRNPGLPAELVDTIPAGCCALVAILRSLHLDNVTVRIRFGAETAQDSARTAGAVG